MRCFRVVHVIEMCNVVDGFMATMKGTHGINNRYWFKMR